MNPTEKRFFSIIVCTYNRADSLRETLDDIDAATPPPAAVELIVVNNNSTDHTDHVCAEFARRCRVPFRALREVQQGLSNARNCGIREAHGDTLIFTDDDVGVPKEWLIEYDSAFRETQATCVFGRIVPEWGGSRPRWYDGKFSPIYGELDYGSTAFVVASRRHEFFGANFALTKQALLDLGGFDPNLGRTPDKLYISEERKIFLRLVEQGAKVAYWPAAWLRHKISARMKTREYVEKYYRDTAYSLVYFSDTNRRRQLLGIPYFRWYEFALFFARLPLRALKIALTGQFHKYFPLKLELLRNVWMLGWYCRRYFAPAKR